MQRSPLVSLPDEKIRAVLQTREWMYRLIRMRVDDIRAQAGSLRKDAVRLLRHYPWDHDLEVMSVALVKADPGSSVGRAKRRARVRVPPGVRRYIARASKLIRDVQRAHEETKKSKLRFP